PVERVPYTGVAVTTHSPGATDSSSRHNRDGCSIEVVVGQTRTRKDALERLLQSEIATGAAGANPAHVLLDEDQLNVTILSQHHQRRGQILGGNMGFLPDRGLRIARLAVALERQTEAGSCNNDAQEN